MKLTKSKLRQIIKEEIESFVENDIQTDEIHLPFDPKLDEFREVMSDLGMAVAYHYKERGADREKSRELIMEVIEAAVDGFKEDEIGGDELKHVLDDVYNPIETSGLEDPALSLSSPQTDPLKKLYPRSMGGPKPIKET